jgi:dienelactone hydrolase
VRVALFVSVCMLCAAPVASAQVAAGFAAAEAQNFLAASGRIQAWTTDPAFLAAPGGVDPARAIARWSPSRGRALAVTWHNRYGAKINGELFAPKTGDGPFPTALVVSGSGVAQDAYRWIAEDLAEHGYVALTFDPQGQGTSDVAPAARFCDPAGDWRKPQELGLTEQGACAGEDPASTAQQLADQVALLAVGRTDHIDPESIGPSYRAQAPRFILGALDATAWLTSGANPWRALVDDQRLAVVGHSLGAYAANMTGNGDPQHRFRAAVAMDAFYADDHGVTPRVPTLMMQSEQEFYVGPHLAPPKDPRSPTTLHPTRATYDAFLQRGDVDAGFLIPAASGHSDFTDELQPASLRGQRTASLAMISWLDEYVAGRGGIARLLAPVAGDTADVSSIGTAQPKIAGRRQAELLSALYPTDLALAGQQCLNLRLHTCAAPAHCAQQARVTATRRAATLHLELQLAPACGRVGRVGVTVRAAGALATRHALLGPTDTATLDLPLTRRRARRALQVVTRVDGVGRRVLRLRAVHG